jgi:glycerol kinase
LARAALDSIAYQVADVLDAMSADSGIAITELRVDGGASMNAGLMGFQADLLHVEVVRPVVSETTALGAAYLAGLAVGYWQNEAEIQAQWQRDSIFAPRLDSETTARLRNGWKRALRAALHWANERPSLA